MREVQNLTRTHCLKTKHWQAFQVQLSIREMRQYSPSSSFPTTLKVGGVQYSSLDALASSAAN
jgi:hypothetical protein